jgi:hypothetical protein
MVQSNDGINIKATLLSRPNNTYVIGYVLNIACPRTSILCNWNTLFAKTILTVVMCKTSLPSA